MSDTVWLLIPIAALAANGRGTYEYIDGRVIWHYGEGLYDTATATLRGDTRVLAFGDGRVETDARIAPARGAQSPLHGTCVGPSAEDQLRLVTYLPGGVFFQEGAIVAHYASDGETVTMATGRLSVQFQVQIHGADTVLIRLDGARMTLRRPRCPDPRLDPQKTFTSACS